jgi:hypothetical protein
MLEYQQPYDHFGRRGQSTVAAALGRRFARAS